MSAPKYIKDQNGVEYIRADIAHAAIMLAAVAAGEKLTEDRITEIFLYSIRNAEKAVP